MHVFSNDLKELLQQDERLVENGRLLRTKVIELGLQQDPLLIRQLLSHTGIKNYLFRGKDEVLIFDKVKFLELLNNKEFFPDAGPSTTNKEREATKEFQSGSKEVVLTWPYKDCVLEGGQTKDNVSRNGTYLNKIQSPDEIKQLFAKKIFTNFQLHTAKGTEKVKEFNSQDNFIIKGDNLLVLHSMADMLRGKVKLIYIDPPYNTGKNAFNYNDAFDHSAWLTFMHNRLTIAARLMSEDGTLWINIDDKESHYLKVMCDEIFGRENFVINFIWQKKYSPANDAKWFSDTHDHILVFARNKKSFKPNLLPRSETMNNRYTNPDNDPRGPWKPGGYSVKTYSKEYDYPIETPSGKIVYPPKGSCWQTSKDNYERKLEDNRIWFGVKGKSKPQIKQFLSEVQQGVVAKSIWTYDEAGHNQVARSEIVRLFGEFVFATPKPEKLLKRIIELATNEGELVLDFFLGSGTTAAVSHKMKRRYIGIDQMDYIHDIAVSRLKKVIAGEQGGVSALLHWKGGGSFKYMELAYPANNADQKKLYMNFSELSSKDHRVPAEDILLNQQFYSNQF